MAWRRRVDLKEAVISARWFRQMTRSFPFRGLHIRVPEPTGSIGLNILHSQLNHEGYQRSGIELRQLLDLAMIRARHESTIDWSELDHRFSAGGFGQVLATYLKFAEVFFGQASPQLSNMPRKLALERFRVFVEWPDRARRRAVYLRLRKENQTLRSQSDVLQQQLAGTQQQLAGSQQQLADILNTTSWKISAPVRVVGKFLRGIRGSAECAP
jgi:hypothetical protein